MDPEPTLIKPGNECGSTDTMLGRFDTMLQCAASCRRQPGCVWFVYGQKGSEKATQCWHEKALSGTCTEGWEPDKCDFCELGAHATFMLAWGKQAV